MSFQPPPCTCCCEHMRFAEGLVGGDGDAGPFLAFGEDLEEELGAAVVQFHVAELVDAEQVHAAVTVDGLGELPVMKPKATTGP